MLTEKQKQEIKDWLKELSLYMNGKKWDTGGPWVCETHFLTPNQDYSFNCKCGAPGMRPLVISDGYPTPIEKEKLCPVCESPLEDNGACQDLGSNNCFYQK